MDKFIMIAAAVLAALFSWIETESIVEMILFIPVYWLAICVIAKLLWLFAGYILSKQ